MTTTTTTTTTLSPLHRADGSATYKHPPARPTTIITGAVNGPVEILRRDELVHEAAIEVSIRPATGVGGVRERHLESLVQTTLRAVVLVQQFPRMLIQVVLQVVKQPREGGRESSTGGLYSTLALLSAGIPLRGAFTSTLVAVFHRRNDNDNESEYVSDPDPARLVHASSVHVFALTLRGEMLLCESEGGGSGWEEWEGALDCARRRAGCGVDEETDVEMEMGTETKTKTRVGGGVEGGREGEPSLESALRKTVREMVDADQSWKAAAAVAVAAAGTI
ncbi:MAG: exosome non-catalytic core subunit rrp46 [Phylliscum demangeonii]|nr:MAG: exosome non-catalytic core subunit rrp46 [Phylliscum demangeonii]